MGDFCFASSNGTGIALMQISERVGFEPDTTL